MKRIQHIRTTRVNLDTQKAASGLLIGELYLITDENRIAVANAVNDYVVINNWNDLSAKQDTLVSGTNIKTINSESLLGSGDLVVSGGESVNIETLAADKTLTASDATIQILQTSANRIINLPTTGLTIGQKFVIWNNNAYNSSYFLQIKQGTTIIDSIYSQRKVEYYWDGTNWYFDNRYNVSNGYNANGYSQGNANGINANGSIYANANGAFANGYNYGNANGYSAYGYNQGNANGYNANGSNYGNANGYNANTNGKGINTTANGAFSTAERNREIVSTATNNTTNKAQQTTQMFKEKDLTTNAGAWQELFIDALSARLTIIASSVYHFLIQINAIDKTTFEVKTWEIKGAIKRNNANVTTLVNSTKTITAADAATTNWDVQVTADDVNEALKVEVKHDSVNSVRYSLNIFATETRI